MNRHYLNNKGFYKLAQSIKDYINRKITGYNKLGTASTKDFTTYVSPTQTDQLPISSSVYSAMTNMLRGAYHPAGSKTIDELTSDLLVKANLGNVYKITEDGVTSDLFIGGAGQTIKTGDNAVVLYASEDTYMFSLESGVVDLDAYQKKELTTAIEGENTVEDALVALSNVKVDTDLVPSNASASNKLVVTSAIYKTLAKDWAQPGSSFIKLSNAYPTNGLRTNNYIVSCRNGETYLLLCGSSDGGSVVAPEIYLLYNGTRRLVTNGFYYDSTTKEIAFMTQQYNIVSVTQISGEVADIVLSTSSSTNPLSNPVAITPQKLVTDSDLNSKGVFQGHIAPNKKLSINMDSYGEVFGYIQAAEIGAVPFRLHHATQGAKIILKSDVTIGELPAQVERSFGTTVTIETSIRIAYINDVWTITNTAPNESSRYWIGGAINSISLSDA